MKIIAAYPCLGMTTILNLNKDRCINRKFDIKRSVEGLGSTASERFFDCCAEIITLQYRSNPYEIMFIDDNDSLIKRLGNDPELKRDIVLIYPNASDWNVMEEYLLRATEFYGAAWVKENLETELFLLPDRIKYFRNEGYDIRLTNLVQKHIGDVYNLPKGFVAPYEEGF
ncbi:MAG: hypothetical protein IJU87_04255 [Lachnospiraceae bacterium]|nr:hypothetical protein [Lachnospiraceae bacterium]